MLGFFSLLGGLEETGGAVVCTTKNGMDRGAGAYAAPFSRMSLGGTPVGSTPQSVAGFRVSVVHPPAFLFFGHGGPYGGCGGTIEGGVPAVVRAGRRPQ